MSEIKLISPILDNFCIGDPISDKNGVRCCPAMKENQDDRYILKVVSIPASQTKLDALLLAGAYPDAAAANEYFRELTQNVVEELEVLNSFTEQDGFLPVRQWQVQPMDQGETGYDVYIVTDYRRTLKRQFYKEPLTHLNAVNLGIDICAALCNCRRAGYLFVDLKPNNIMVTEDKRFRISDLGFAKLNSLGFASLPERYRSPYTAPEVEDAFCSLSNTMDIYALGLVLYQAYNNGALPFASIKAPAEVFPAPAYADEEMAQIILKACDPNPANRWQDPAEMGQALVGYMQKVGANDTPIVPPAPEEPEVPAVVAQPDLPVIDETEELVPETDSQEETADAEETEIIEEAEPEVPALVAAAEDPEEAVAEDPEILAEDAPEETAVSEEEAVTDEAESVEEIAEGISEVLYVEDTASEPMPTADDISKILAQVENLTNEEIPDPVLEDESTDEESVEQEETPSDSDQKTMVFNVPQEDTAPDTQEQEDVEKPKRKGARRWIILAIVLVLLAGIGFGVYYGYKNYYVRTIESIEMSHEHGKLTITVTADAKTDLNTITVHCSGNDTRDSKTLTNGSAVFSIVPGKLYTIELEISGFHTLKGETSTTYITDEKVIIDELLIQVGEEDGTALLNFTPRASEEEEYTGKWIIEYDVDGQNKQSITSDTTEVTLTGLTVGETYNISIYPEIGRNWGEITTLFVAQPVILAEDVTITQYAAGTLGLSWSAPADTTVSSWTVHCYAPDGSYNASPDPVTESAITFTGLDLSKDYTVEIYAENQTKPQIAYVEDTTLSIQNLTAAINEEYFLELTWDCEKEIPEGGWNVSCTVSGMDQPEETYQTTENSLILHYPVPGCTYTFSVAPANGSFIVANETELTVGDTKDYQNDYFDGDIFSKDHIEFKMCSRPEGDSWDGSNPKYTTTFKAGEFAGFITKATKIYSEKVKTDIYIFYIVRDANGKIVLFAKNEPRPWNSMFKEYNGYLTVPQLPEEAGQYTLEVFFNGQYVYTQEFEMTE